LQNAGREHRVVVLTGPRQVGKSTLLRRATPFSNWRYYTFDDHDVLRQAEAEPQFLWVLSAKFKNCPRFCRPASVPWNTQRQSAFCAIGVNKSAFDAKSERECELCGCGGVAPFYERASPSDLWCGILSVK